MGLVRNVAKNSLAMGAVQIVGQVSTLILAMFLSRYLGDGYTTYTAAFSIATVLFIIADFGMGFQMVVEVAPNKEIAPQYLTNALLLRGLLGLVAVAITAAMVVVENLPATVSLAFMTIAIATSFNWIAQTFTSMFTAFEKMHYVLYTSLIERIFTVTISIVLVVMGFGLEVVVLVVLAGCILNALLSYIVCSRLVVKPARKVDVRGSIAQLRDAVQYGLNGALTSSLYALNGFLLLTIIWGIYGMEEGTLANTNFYVAFNLVVSLVAIPTVFRTALLPVISRLYHSSRELARLTQQKVMKYMFTFGLPMTVGGFILADKIIQFFFPNYPAAAGVFRILIPVIAISYFGTGMGSVLASANRIRLNTASVALGAAVNLVLCLVLIPSMQADGAALAFMMSTLITNLLSYYFLVKNIFKVDIVDITVKPVVAAMGMGVALLLIPGADFFLSLGVGAGVYFVLLFALKAINHEDTEIILKIMKKEA